jgi:hypothetical protein
MSLITREMCWSGQRYVDLYVSANGRVRLQATTYDGALVIGMHCSSGRVLLDLSQSIPRTIGVANDVLHVLVWHVWNVTGLPAWLGTPIHANIELPFQDLVGLCLDHHDQLCPKAFSELHHYCDYRILPCTHLAASCHPKLVGA